MICGRLKGKPCGDYGLRVVLPSGEGEAEGGNRSADMCQVG